MIFRQRTLFATFEKGLLLAQTATASPGSSYNPGWDVCVWYLVDIQVALMTVRFRGKADMRRTLLNVRF